MAECRLDRSATPLTFTNVVPDARADAVWVGWGFVAEDASFADLVESLGITFIGPSGDAMRKLGDKIGSKLIAEEVGVPVAPWSRGGVDTLDEALAAAERIGYPLMLKATAGGGGRGIRKVTTPDELEDAYQRTRDEAERAFGSGVVFLEALVTGARHVEVQVIADGQGTAWAIGVRDCTVQRRNQKIIEESASPLLTSEQSNSVKMTFAKNRVEISASTPDVGEAKETVPVKYSGKELMVSFNPEFLLDPLKNLVTDQVYFELNDSISPGVVKTDDPFLYVIMPMRMS